MQRKYLGANLSDMPKIPIVGNSKLEDTGEEKKEQGKRKKEKETT